MSHLYKQPLVLLSLELGQQHNLQTSNFEGNFDICWKEHQFKKCNQKPRFQFQPTESSVKLTSREAFLPFRLIFAIIESDL